MRTVRALLLGLFLGLLIGATTAFLEISGLLLAHQAGSIISGAFYFPGMVIYALVWGLGGLLLAGIGAASLLVILGAVALFAIGVGYINSAFLPSYTDPQSILVNLVALGVLIFLGLRARRRLARTFTGWELSHPRRLGRALGAWAVVVGAILLLGAIRTLKEARRAGALPAPAARWEAQHPNVLIILIDTLRADHLSSYRYPRPTSPAIDSASAEGALFLQARAQTSWTKPATASIMTGLYPSAHQTNILGSGLRESLTILPEVFRAHGYRTGLFTGNNVVSPLFGFDQGVDHFYYGKAQMIRELMLGNLSRASTGFYLPLKLWVSDLLWQIESRLRLAERMDYSDAAPALTADFLRWVQQDPGARFFAYLHFIEPHYPYEPPPPYDRLFDSSYRGDPGIHPFPYRGFQPFDQGMPLPREDREFVVAKYDGEIRALDGHLGALFARLRELGLWDRTVLLVTADHGEEFYEHGGWGHGHSLLGEVVEIPLILRFPARIPPGIQVPCLARQVDIFPTILDLAGLPAPSGLEGSSLLPFLEGRGDCPPPASSYAELFHGGNEAWSLEEGRYKLIRARKGPQERISLYDLEADPEEMQDLASEHPDLRARLLSELDATYARSRAKGEEVVPVAIDKGTEDRLRAMGYID